MLSYVLFFFWSLFCLNELMYFLPILFKTSFPSLRFLFFVKCFEPEL